MLFVGLFDLCLFGFVGFLFLGVWEGLRFVIVALSGLFSYLFFYTKPLYSNAKLTAFLRNACILRDTCLGFTQATVISILRIVHMYKYTHYTPNSR